MLREIAGLLPVFSGAGSGVHPEVIGTYGNKIAHFGIDNQ